jgi:hypothetical protein
MKKYILIVVALSVLSYSFSDKSFIKNLWQETAIKVDGNCADWNQSFRYDNKSKFLYNISNDDKNLYICLKVMEEKNQLTILRYGLTFWFDTTGKKKERIGVGYPLELDMKKKANQENFMEPRPGEKIDMKAMKKKMVEEQKEIELTGFKIPSYSENSIITGLKNKMKIEVGIGFDSVDAMVYEMLIPLSILYKNPTAMLADTNRTLGLMMISGVKKATLPTSAYETGMPSSMGGVGGGGHGQQGGSRIVTNNTDMRDGGMVAISTNMRIKMAKRKY